MTPHLSDESLIELAEENAARPAADRSAAAHPHLAECAQCRQMFEDARAALLRLSAVDVPEPSPLFWNHLSARVHEAIESGDAGPAPARAWLPAWGWRSAIFAGLMVTLALIAGAQIAVRRHHAQVPLSAKSVSEPAYDNVHVESISDPAAIQDEADGSWQLVCEMASSADLDTTTRAGGFALQPGAAERAALQLTPDEQRELVRLLRAAVERRD